MTSQEFQNYNKETGYCTHCNIERPKSLFTSDRLYKSGTGCCKICDWIKRHNGIPIFDSFTESEMYSIIEELFINDITYVNDLAEKLGKDISDIILAIHTLKIGNKKLLYRYNCAYCGKECFTNPQKYMENHNLYCSHSCYSKDKPSKLYDNVDRYYEKTNSCCTNCGKAIWASPNRLKRTNRFSDNHIFCSYKCFWEFNSKYYRGDRHFKVEITDETREKMKKARAKSLNSLDRLNTKIQSIVNNILDSINIKYQREYTVEFYSIDNYLLDYNLMIEVQGNYWHCNPLFYNKDKYLLNQKQLDGIHRDKIKHSYIKNHCNVEILYLWETDIEKRPDVCQALILLYVNNNGILSNYHSFNYDLVDGELKLKEDLIIPYQNIPCNEYKHLLKNPA